jgi:HK97 gp10 family phage protein
MASSLRGVPRLRRKLRRMEPEVRASVAAAVLEGAEEIRDEAKRRVPTDTGSLRDYIQVVRGASSDRLSWRVGVPVPKTRRGKPKRQWPFYAIFIEFGTVRMRARPFLFPAFEARKRAVFARIRKAVDRALAKVANGG